MSQLFSGCGYPEDIVVYVTEFKMSSGRESALEPSDSN